MLPREVSQGLKALGTTTDLWSSNKTNSPFDRLMCSSGVQSGVRSVPEGVYQTRKGLLTSYLWVPTIIWYIPGTDPKIIPKPQRTGEGGRQRVRFRR